MSARQARLARRANFLSRYHGRHTCHIGFDLGMRMAFREFRHAAFPPFPTLGALGVMRPVGSRWGGTEAYFDMVIR